MSKRIYYVHNKRGDDVLVRAHSQAQAIHKAAEAQYSAEVASQETLVALLGQGATVLEAGVHQSDTLEGNTAT